MKAGDGIRTHDVQLGKLETQRISGDSGKTYKTSPATPASNPDNPAQNQAQDPDLAAIVKVWPTLPSATRQAIVAVAKAAGGGGR